jgi:hypothetical protein
MLMCMVYSLLSLQSWQLYVLLLDGEGGCNERQVIIHIIHSELQFPWKMFLAYITFVTNILILLLPEHLQTAVTHYQSIFRPMCI